MKGKAGAAVLATVIICLITFGIPSKAYALAEVTRLYGDDRYNTAVEISMWGWKQGSNNVVLATGEDFPDALCAAPLASKLDAPILLTGKSTLGNRLHNELKRLGVKKAFIIGGEGAISSDIEKELKLQGIEYIRLFGEDRYQTSIKIADYIAANFSASKEIVVVTGEDFPDALSIAPIAAKKGVPIILSPQNTLLDSIKMYINRNSVVKSYIIGGSGAISDSLKQQLPSPERVCGNDRYETNIEVLQRFSTEFNFNITYIATGENFPDALTGSAVAPKTSSPVLLTGTNSYNAVKEFLDGKTSSIKHVNILGGEGALPSPVINTLVPHIASIEDMEIIISKGASFTLPKKISAHMSDSSVREFDVIWNQNNADANVEGVYSIKGTVEGYSRIINLKIIVSAPVKINSISGVDDTITMIPGKSFKLTPAALSAEAKELNNVKFSYSSSKPEVVVVDENGMMTAVSRGIIVVNIKAENSVSEVSTPIIIIVSDRLEVTDIAKESGSVVYIEVYDESRKPLGYGSGFIISEDGKVITNFHVIDNASYGMVTMENGTRYEIEGVLNYDVLKDIALIKLKNASSLKAVKLGNSDNLKKGNEIVAIGSPMGYKNTVSTGIVSGFRESDIRSGQDIQISAPIASGSSGGALFDMYGEVIGITYAGHENVANINFAIPINESKAIFVSNTVKTLAEVNNEVHPRMSYEEFTRYLNNNFSTYNTGGFTLKIDSASAQEESSTPKNVYVFLIMYRDNHTNFLNYLSNNIERARTDIEDWILTIAEETASQYQSKTVSGGLWYIDEFSYCPNNFPQQDVSYDSVKGLWKVSHQEIFFSNSSPSGEFTLLWQ